MAKQYKLQVELSATQLESLEMLQEAGDLRTKKELLDTAFTLLKWAVNKKKEGSSIISIDPKGNMKELELPYLENVKAKALTLGLDREPVPALPHEVGV